MSPSVVRPAARITRAAPPHVEASVAPRRYRSVVIAFCALSLALSASGCAFVNSFFAPPRLPTIANPIAELDEIAIVPVAAEDAASSSAWTEHLRGELLRVQGVERVRVVAPDQVRMQAGQLPELPDSARGLLRIDVLRFDPYYPPRAHLEIDFYAPPSFAGTSGRDVLALDRQGGDPVAAGSRRREPRLRFQSVLRADDPAVVRAIEQYAAAQRDDDRGLNAVDRVTRVSDRFMAFVVYETLKECFSRLDDGEGLEGREANTERKWVRR
ncbi:MAG: hypothetical protein AB7O52_08970 [Planctomycetota bacterium]